MAKNYVERYSTTLVIIEKHIKTTVIMAGYNGVLLCCPGWSAVARFQLCNIRLLGSSDSHASASRLLRRLRQENRLNLGAGDCTTATPAWATERDSVSKKKKYIVSGAKQRRRLCPREVIEMEWLKDGVTLHCPGWSAVVRSLLTAASASRVQQFSCCLPSSWDYRHAPSCLANFFVFLVEMRFHRVGQASPKLLTSSDSPTSASQSGGITGVSHCAWPVLDFLSRVLYSLTACIHGSAAMLYPMYWQHVYIPVLPPHLLDYCWTK
ncbi:Protein GVQW1 [Plecturocebus cupreus]